MDKVNKINSAITEAQRFVQTAFAWKKRIKEDDAVWTSKEGGACKRASMDLTRALTELRLRRP